MNIDKTMVMIGILLSSILIIENFAISSGMAYLFLNNSSIGLTLLICLIIGIFLGYGLRGYLGGSKRKDENDDYDF